MEDEITSGKRERKSAEEDFYVQETCCTSCGVPQSIAPDLVGWTEEKHGHCYWIKQPQTAEEFDRAVRIVHTQELGCHRYSGSDPAVLKRLPAEDCDHLRPVMKMRTGSRPMSEFASSGPAPNFSLSESDQSGLFRKLWQRLFRKRS